MNIAECELSLLTRQTLLLAAWTASRNATPHPVNWQFTTSDAQVKLKSIYPIYNRDKTLDWTEEKSFRNRKDFNIDTSHKAVTCPSGFFKRYTSRADVKITWLEAARMNKKITLLKSGFFSRDIIDGDFIFQWELKQFTRDYECVRGFYCYTTTGVARVEEYSTRNAWEKWNQWGSWRVVFTRTVDYNSPKTNEVDPSQIIKVVELVVKVKALF